MLNDLIKKRPDVQRAWLEAELDAQIFLADPEERRRSFQIGRVSKPSRSIARCCGRALWRNRLPAVGAEVKIQLDYIINDRAKELLTEATAFLNGLPNKPAAEATIRPEALDDKVAREVLAARGLQSPDWCGEGSADRRIQIAIRHCASTFTRGAREGHGIIQRQRLGRSLNQADVSPWQETRVLRDRGRSRG